MIGKANDLMTHALGHKEVNSSPTEEEYALPDGQGQLKALQALD